MPPAGSHASFLGYQNLSIAEHALIHLAAYAPGRISPWPFQEPGMKKVPDYGNTDQYSPLGKEEIPHTSANVVLGKVGLVDI
ncbi:hypothetical protein M378DRAFT_168488 [Amanita muscaria Koide BX008]|uniref:Uncharacterized protein n=1 Tax=Amanita muscaria (strain Koide BX008) TaxID=946122 RepID=A0A0C2SB96_AMAMK|nr:hypothetical protein M378DRAFT_168488 [Amanita muscaria Koide BX008]